jgi:hypothetical protein
MTKPRGLLATIATASLIAGIKLTAADAQTLVEEWDTAKLPPPPALKPAKIDPTETALLVMDFTTQTCTAARRPRCAASVAKVQKLVAEARAKGAFVIYSVAVPGSTASDILKELTPASGEPVLPPLGPTRVTGGNAWIRLIDTNHATVVPPAEFAMKTELQVGGRSLLLFELINDDARRP